jgi:hypothetical protein
MRDRIDFRGVGAGVAGLGVVCFVFEKRAGRGRAAAAALERVEAGTTAGSLRP